MLFIKNIVTLIKAVGTLVTTLVRRHSPRSRPRLAIVSADTICSGSQNVRRQSSLPALYILCPRQESNLDRKLRKLAFYPLNYEGNLTTPD